MKLISSFFRFLAFVLVLIFILLLPLSLLARNVGLMLFDREVMVELLGEHLLDSEVAAAAVQEGVQTMFESTGEVEEGSEEGAVVNQMVREGLTALDEEDWVRLIELIAPKELLTRSLAQAMGGLYEWLDNDEVAPRLMMDLKPWKRNIDRNAVVVMEMVLNALPQCTPAEIQEILLGGGAVEADAFPMCRPPEPIYSELLSRGAALVPKQLAKSPNVISLGRQLDVAEEELLEIKNGVRNVRTGLLFGWALVAGLLLLAIPMGARSIVGFFRWVGWPVLIGGILSALVAVLLLISSGVVVENLDRFFTDIPSAMLIPVEALLSGALETIGGRMLAQAGVLTVLSVMALLAALVIAKIQARKAETAEAETMTAQVLVDEAPGMESKPAEAADEAEDKEHPQGMFG